MEPKKISTLLPKPCNESLSLHPTSSQATTSDISLYSDERPIPSDIANEVIRLKNCFPEIDSGFTTNLIDRITANGFTKQRLHDAISHVIDTCHYPRPKIAEIVSFDRKVKTYTYTEMIALCTPFKTSDNFEMIQVGNKKRWVEK